MLALRGEVTITDSHHIDTAAAATIQAGICHWLLRNKISTMNTTEILNCSKEIVKAKQARDTEVKALNLDATPKPMDLRSYIVQESGQQ